MEASAHIVTIERLREEVTTHAHAPATLPMRTRRRQRTANRRAQTQRA